MLGKSAVAFVVLLANLFFANGEAVRLERRGEIAPAHRWNWTQIRSLTFSSKGDGRIAGGVESKPHSRPYQAAILVEKQNVYFCGGALVSMNFVLTTASCVDGAKYLSVVLGAHDLKEQEETQQLFSSNFYVRHHAWNPKTNANNIALLKLSTSASKSPAVQPVKIQSSNWVPGSAILSGWGKISDSAPEMAYKLREAELPVISNQMCEEIIEDVTNLNVCTSGKGKKGACDADAGDPLVASNELIGIVSFINSPCQSNFPTVYVKVLEYVNWIKANSDV